MIAIDAEAGTHRRRAVATPSSSAAAPPGSAPEPHYGSGALWRYAQTVGDAHLGAVTHPGGKAETHVYADI